MIFTAENILLIGAILIFCSILISKTGYRFGIPTLLLFLLVGMGFGSDGLGLQFNNAGEAQFIGMMALSIILFTGGMDTKINDIRPVLWQGISLSTLGVLLTTLLTGGFIYYLSKWTSTNIALPLLTCLLLAATMSSTDSASVFNLLRSQKMNLKHNLRPMLELESGSNDPMAYMLTIALIQVIASGSDLHVGLVLRDLLIQFCFGGIFGFALGKFALWLLNKINLSNSSLYPILLLSMVFITFTVTDLLKGNGYLAVYIMGTCMGAILHQRGFMPLHGSCVTDGSRAILITGDSGAGKSTLAAEFLSQGWKLLTDDVCAVSDPENNPTVQSSYPSQKLWQDSLEQYHRSQSDVHSLYFSETREKFGVDASKFFLNGTCPLQMIVYLVPTDNPCSITKLDCFTALDQLMNNTYRIFMVQPEYRQRHFQRCAALAQKIPMVLLTRQKGVQCAGKLYELITTYPSDK